MRENKIFNGSIARRGNTEKEVQRSLQSYNIKVYEPMNHIKNLEKERTDTLRY